MWPYDDRYYEATPGVPIPSELDLEIQDRIIDLHADRSIVLPSYESCVDGGGLDHAWAKNSGGIGFTCLAGGYDLHVRGQLLSSAVLKEVHVKWYLNSAAGMKLDLYLDDYNFGSPTTPPSSDPVGSQLSPSLGSYPGWDVSSWTGLTTTVNADSAIRVVVSDPDVGDQICGVKMVLQPLTASP